MLEDTLIGYIVKNATKMPDEIAFTEKRYGIWNPTTWKEFHDKVQRFALGLRSLGFGPEDKMCIIGDNKPEWIIAEFGAMSQTLRTLSTCFWWSGTRNRWTRSSMSGTGSRKRSRWSSSGTRGA
ncbi:MAG: AMP-binding protein [Deltaproteobacteria bacterium]|nr:AMP-binding protein [Deltaproteobacteria bacterium]